ncbi:MAG: EAL domain-containing response regulator [Hyphomonadaceae bacterium]|nr:EAL domain-containing response regulator [Hyphomonadaceae bacterium]
MNTTSDYIDALAEATAPAHSYHSGLVIDDDPLLQVIAQEALLSGGVQDVQTADDGVLGLETLAASNNAIDLLVVDLQMPNMTGVDVIRELSRVSYGGAVIILSSEESSLLQSVKSMAKISGITILGALAKPLDVEALHKLLYTDTGASKLQRTRIISRPQTLKALNDDYLVPYYQPKIDLQTNTVVGFEILARCADASETDPAPFDYLDAIEKYGLSVEFLCKMITRAALEIAQWPHARGAMKLCFNLTPLAVQDSGLPDRLLSVVKAAGLEPNRVTFEITENHLLEQTAESLEVLSLMRLYGFGLSIDDFGTGATGIEQLRSFPFTELKIDGRFMMASKEDEFSRLTVQTSVKLASLLGMRVVAEGVETQDAISFARAAGAHEVQGFHFARPMPAAEASAWLSAHNQPNEFQVG